MASYNKKEHLRANIEAIKTVFALHREQRTATPEERTVLEAYTGFGALKCILSPANTMEDIARWNKSELELFPLVMELHRTIRDNTTSESQYKSYMQSLKNSVMTAGSIIEGSVENSVCFRNVRIEKGAVVKNCVLMEKCVVKAGARLENVVCDKGVTITAGTAICGTAEHPCVLPKGGVV